MSLSKKFSTGVKAATMAAMMMVVAVILSSCHKTNSKKVAEPESPPLSEFKFFPDTLVMTIGSGIDPNAGPHLRFVAKDLSGNTVDSVIAKMTSSNPDKISIGVDGRINFLKPGMATITATAGGKTATAVLYAGDSAYDVATQGPPYILGHDFIDLDKIHRISKFRSTVGHSYTDGSGETCRSMKHYFEPLSTVDWTKVDIYAPTSGNIWIRPDGAYGYAIFLQPKALPAMIIQIFHVTLDSGTVNRMWVTEGQHLGVHASSHTLADIAMAIGGINGVLLSYFDVMTDKVFEDIRKGVSPVVPMPSPLRKKEMLMLSHVQGMGNLPCMAPFPIGWF